MIKSVSKVFPKYFFVFYFLSTTLLLAANSLTANEDLCTGLRKADLSIIKKAVEEKADIKADLPHDETFATSLTLMYYPENYLDYDCEYDLPPHLTEEKAYEITAYLLDQGADIDRQDGIGWSPLLHTIEAGYKSVFDLLIERNAKINHVLHFQDLDSLVSNSYTAREYQGYNPLLLALEFERDYMIDVLLTKKAIIPAVVNDKDSRTICDSDVSIAARKNNAKIFGRLLEEYKRRNINICDVDCFSDAFLCAEENESIEIFNMLLGECTVEDLHILIDSVLCGVKIDKLIDLNRRVELATYLNRVINETATKDALEKEPVIKKQRQF